MAGKTKKKWQTPGVVFQPEVYRGMLQGINQLTRAIRPTYGPMPRRVVSEFTASRNRRPEMLDNGAIIARRVVQIQGREEDMGAMFLRHMLWKLHETSGDGTTMAALLFQSIFQRGVRFITAGGNAMHLRRAIEACAATIETELEKREVQLRGKQSLARLAEAISFDPYMGKLMGEIFDIIGAYGRLEIRSGRSAELEREYVEGMYWDGAICSREMIEDVKVGRAHLENLAVYISDLEVNEPQDLIPVLEAAIQGGHTALLLVVRNINEKSLSVLLNQSNRKRLHVVAVKSPAIHADVRRHALQDIAVITGGKAFFKDAGDSLSQVKPEDLGKARRAWADTNFFGLIGGRGDPRQVRQHIATVRAAYRNCKDTDESKRLRERLGKLIGGAAILWVGASTPLGVETRKELAESTAEAMRGALRDGVVPGGGVTLLEISQILRRQARETTLDYERTACLILSEALEAPFRVLLQNAGHDPSRGLAEVLLAGEGWGFDVVAGKVVRMADAGIFDSAAVIKLAVLSAIRSAALALTVDVMVHRANPPESMQTS